MRLFHLTTALLAATVAANAQQITPSAAKDNNKAENIYEIKKEFLYKVLHNPREVGDEKDNDLTRFNRWFHMVEPRTYPSGNLPRPDVLLHAAISKEPKKQGKAARTTADPTWQPVGPMNSPSNNNGIGRINCIVIDPLDTGKIYVGAACGGVFISKNSGATWTSNSDQFPSLSVADIAVNPIHTDTIYAATGDGYGYETGAYDLFWGGLYSAGVMKSTNGGNTWTTTGLSYLQSNRDIIQRLIIHPRKTSTLLAATRNGLLRTTDAGATWSMVDTGHTYSLAFRPGQPDTVYSINRRNLRVSYNAGATWQTLYTNISPSLSRSTIAVSPAAPNTIWVLDAGDDLKISRNGGLSFTTVVSPSDTANFYGYYDRVLAISPADSNYIVASGMRMAFSTISGYAWMPLDADHKVHVDNHAYAFNPKRPSIMYSGHDGGVSITRNNGYSWRDLNNGLMISQIYKMGSSLQEPYRMVCGLQDNGTFINEGTIWKHKIGGDGMDCAIHPMDDGLQVGSYQYGNFYLSADQGNSFNWIDVTSEDGAWVTPVVMDPQNPAKIYFGYQNIYMTPDWGGTFNKLTITLPFSQGARSMAISESDTRVLYAADYSKIIKTTDGGGTWSNITGGLPVATVAITNIAVNPRNSQHVLVSTSGYEPGTKVFMSTNGGTTWTNFSMNLPNIPVNCLAVDSSTPGAVFAGTDMGVYYTDSSMTGWVLYNTGLPNVIINDLDINYNNYKVRAATFGRGVWECKLRKNPPPGVGLPTDPNIGALSLKIAPNPATENWHILFANKTPTDYTVTVYDISGKEISTIRNSDVVHCNAWAPGAYNIKVTVGNAQYSLIGIKK